jgi:hypothetical protein
MDTIRESLDELTLDALEHHPKIREKILAQLKTCADIRFAKPDTLAHRQGNVEMLDWFLKLPMQIMEEQRRAKATGR